MRHQIIFFLTVAFFVGLFQWHYRHNNHRHYQLVADVCPEYKKVTGLWKTKFPVLEDEHGKYFRYYGLFRIELSPRARRGTMPRGITLEEAKPWLESGLWLFKKTDDFDSGRTGDDIRINETKIRELWRKWKNSVVNFMGKENNNE